MGDQLSIGDRVRVVAERLVHGYQPDSRGTVRSVPTTDKSGKTYYAVSMDKDAPDDSMLFLADEVKDDK
jgi:hypothetical protein